VRAGYLPSSGKEDGDQETRRRRGRRRGRTERRMQGWGRRMGKEHYFLSVAVREKLQAKLHPSTNVTH
jgi:hypothetical protein